MNPLVGRRAAIFMSERAANDLCNLLKTFGTRTALVFRGAPSPFPLHLGGGKAWPLVRGSGVWIARKPLAVGITRSSFLL